MANADALVKELGHSKPLFRHYVKRPDWKVEEFDGWVGKLPTT